MSKVVIFEFDHDYKKDTLGMANGCPLGVVGHKITEYPGTNIHTLLCEQSDSLIYNAPGTTSLYVDEQDYNEQDYCWLVDHFPQCATMGMIVSLRQGGHVIAVELMY
jgi:hypothetical protein